MKKILISLSLTLFALLSYSQSTLDSIIKVNGQYKIFYEATPQKEVNVDTSYFKNKILLAEALIKEYKAARDTYIGKLEEAQKKLAAYNNIK